MNNRFLAVPGSAYRPSIDGIRAVAVLSVFFFHLYPALLPGGFLGVDVFFVISGYLITGIILRETRAGAFSFARFYARRVKRIFPALFAVLFLSVVTGILLLSPQTYLNFIKSARYAAAQLANFFFARTVGYFDEGFAGQPLLHTWSLGVEEQFYLFWPLLIVFFFLATDWMRRGSAATAEKKGLSSRSGSDRIVAILFLVLTALSFLACFFLAGVRENTAFYMFYTRAWEFCLGGLAVLRLAPALAAGRANTVIQLTGAFLIGCSMLFVGREFLGGSFLRFGVILPCLGAALLLHASDRDGPINRALASPAPVFVGRISYSLYLYHWPIIIFYKLYSNVNEISLPAAIGIIAIAFLLATASYLFIEQPARRTTWTDRPVLAFGAVAILVFTVAFNNMEGFSEAPWRVASYQSDAAQTPRAIPVSCQGGVNNGILHYECATVRQADAPVIALVGDSHSPHYLPATTFWARRNGYNVKHLGVPGCPMLLGEINMESRIDPSQTEQCNRALPFFQKEIVDNPRVRIILIAQRFDLFYDGRGYSSPTRQILFKGPDGAMIEEHTDYYRRQLEYTIEAIRAKGKEPVLLKQAPILGNMGDCKWEPLLKQWTGARRDCTFDRDFIKRWQQPSIDFIDQVAARHRVMTYDPFPALPSPLHGEINLYQNNDHLNPHGFQRLIPSFAQAMKAFAPGREQQPGNQQRPGPSPPTAQ